MNKFTALAAIISIGLMAGSAHAQSRATETPTQRPTLNLKAPKITSSGTFVRCRVTDMALTDEGLGFTCVTSSNKSYLVATVGGRMPSGLNAVTNLVMKMAEKPTYYRRIRVKEAKGNALKVCGLVRGTSAAKDGRTCVQAMAVQMSASDSPVSTGDANPSGPNIPTAPANPNGPSIPTAPANPNGPNIPTAPARPD